jgi:hypothetical protein
MSLGNVAFLYYILYIIIITTTNTTYCNWAFILWQ